MDEKNLPIRFFSMRDNDEERLKVPEILIYPIG